jgi:predicted NAD-dependent protein-ADP-ribosyltransferase YbiA (DUF1768 family)
MKNKNTVTQDQIELVGFLLTQHTVLQEWVQEDPVNRFGASTEPSFENIDQMGWDSMEAYDHEQKLIEEHDERYAEIA